MSKAVKINTDFQVLKLLSPNELKVLASDIRSDILSVTWVNGGHLSSNLGTVELTMSLLRNFDPLKDDLLFDVGHQTYTYKILTGRDITNLRKTGGVAPFSDTTESPFDKYNNGHAATSVSCAYGMALAKGLAKDPSYTMALIGDSSVVSGLSMEALNLLSTDKKTRLIIILNDNGMSIGKGVGFMTKRFQKLRNSRFYFRTSSALGKSMSKHRLSWRLFLRMRSFKDHFRRLVIRPTVFEAMGIKYIGPFDGHDFDALDLAFEKAKLLVNNGPVMVHVITQKGYGYLPASEDEVGKFHGVSPHFDAPTMEMPIPALDFTEIKASYFFRKMATDPKLFFITPAMERGSGLEGIFSKYPERCLDVGIAEENAVTLASGLALKGYHPVVDIYSTFMQRSYDEILEDISRNNVSCTFLVERAGLVGEDGASHHGLYDVAMVRSIPKAHCYLPFDSETCQFLFESRLFITPGPTFIRFPKDKPIAHPKAYSLTGGLAFFHGPENKVLLLGTGPLGYQVLERFDDCQVDKAVLLDLLPPEEIFRQGVFDHYEGVFLYDPYSTEEGSASYFASQLLKTGFKGRYQALSFKNDFVTFGQNEDLYRLTGMDPDAATKAIQAFLDSLKGKVQ